MYAVDWFSGISNNIIVQEAPITVAPIKGGGSE